jgi:hypothetical protein
VTGNKELESLKITHSIEQSSFQEIDSHSASQEVAWLLELND